MFLGNSKHKYSRTILSAMLLCLLAATTVSCAFDVQTFKDKYVSAGEIRSPFNLISPHVGGWYYIKVNGVRYQKVRGTAPFYLRIPELNSILFVTGDQKTTFHIFNIRTKQQISILGDGINFGGDIGGHKKPGEAFTDWVKSATTNQIVLAKQYPAIGAIPPARILITLNLKTRKMERVEREYRDKNGKLVQEPIK